MQRRRIRELRPEDEWREVINNKIRDEEGEKNDANLKKWGVKR